MNVPVILRRRRFQYGGGVVPFSPVALSGLTAWFAASPDAAFLSATDLTPASVGDRLGFYLNTALGAGYSAGSFTGLGSELVTNGAFDTDITGWTNSGFNSTVSWSAGKLRLTDTFGPHAAYQALSATAGVTYLIYAESTIISGAPDFVQLVVSSSASAVSTAVGAQLPVSGSGSTYLAWTAPSTGNFYIQLSASGNIITEWDNISVRELPANHAVQANLAPRPFLRQTAGGVYHLESDGLDDALPWTAPAGTYTIGYVNTAGTVTILTGQALNGATDILLDTELVEYVAYDRALTAQETADLTTYLEGRA